MAAVPELSDELKDQIAGAPVEESDLALSRRLGVHRNTVAKYRKRARQERQESARQVLARHVETNIPDALKDLTDLRGLAREKFEGTGDPRHGQLWLGAIKTTLEHVTPDDADLDAAIRTELERLADSAEAPAARTPAPEAVGNGAGRY